ncbi:glycosyl transferase [Nocardia sp. NPDC057668]|uniref:glycosyl transferase n=1 Tax=Nocardia sp. NPDC057668 TaxID=3346202 RepID=UPI00366E6488
MEVSKHDAPEAPPRRRRPSLAGRLRAARTDVLIGLGYLALAVFVVGDLWRNTGTGYLTNSDQDQILYEWFYALGAHNITDGASPFFTTLQNYPDGVNLMANTLMYGFGVPFAPVTLLFGPTVTFVLALTLGLSGTAFGWYWVFSRELVSSKAAAALGGVFCGFAPAMISHTNGHPNFVFLVLLPFIAQRVVKMARLAQDAPEAGSERRPRDSIVLGLLVALQISLGEEPLLIFALAFAVFGLAYLRTRAAIVRTVRVIAPPVGLAALITLTLTAIPLGWQFFGPQSYRFVGLGRVGNDILAPFQFSAQSAGAALSIGPDVEINPTEHNSYFGWPLVLVLLVATALLWRERIVRACLVVALGFSALSMGIVLSFAGNYTIIPMPWILFGWIPPVNGIIESRFTMAAVPAMAIVMTLATQRAIDHWRTAGTRWQPIAWFTALACALAPIAPTMLPVSDRSPTPVFFTDGTVEGYLSGGGVMSVPPATAIDTPALQWQVDSDFAFPLVGGYFVGPDGADGRSRYGADERPTSRLLTRLDQLERVLGSTTVPVIDQADRDQAVIDLRYWETDVLVLDVNEDSVTLRTTVDQLLGIPARQVGGVWLWDVRHLR